MYPDDRRNGDPTTIQSLLGEAVTCNQRLRSQDRTRIQTAYTILESSYADLVEFVDGPITGDPYFTFDQTDNDTVREGTFILYKFVHHYLAALYSFNEAIRSTVSAYLPNEYELHKGHFDPDNVPGIEYSRRLVYLRGLRTAAQHGVFNDCFSVRQWDSSSNRYRLEFDPTAFSRQERLRNPGQYLRYSNRNQQREPLRYLGSFHEQNFYHFYADCFAWFETY